MLMDLPFPYIYFKVIWKGVDSSPVISRYNSIWSLKFSEPLFFLADSG